MCLWRCDLNLSRAFYVQMFSVTALTQLKRFWFKAFCFGFFHFLVVDFLCSFPFNLEGMEKRGRWVKEELGMQQQAWNGNEPRLLDKINDCCYMVTSFLFFFKHKNKIQCFGLVILAGAVSEAPSECVQVCDVLCECELSLCDHARVWERFIGAALPHLYHRSGGVPVFRWSRVWLGFTCVCPQGRGLLQLSVCQRHRSQWNTRFRSVWCSHLHNFEQQNKLENGWRMEINQSPVPSVFSNFCFCRLRRTGWTVLAYFYHCVFYEQLSDAAEWFPFWPVWYYSDSALRNVSPAP